MNNLKDIKSIVTVPDDSLMYLLIAMTGLVLAGFFIWKVIKIKQNNDRKIAIEKLKKLDFTDSKTVAYDFKRHAQILCNEENKAKFEQINGDLEQYKYKKHVADLEEVLIQKIKDFIHV
jgi:hypothetical protein